MRSRVNEAKTQRAVDFFEKLLVHTKGTWARSPFKLAPFQREIIEALFGTETYDRESRSWVRRYNLAWLEMGRKNGKSELMAGLALLLTGGDDEEGAEVYGVAKDTDQASLVFNVAKRMVELSPVLSQHFKLYPTNRRIVYPRTSSYYRVIAADALGNLGQDPHGILFDEIIAQPNGDLWDALKTGFGSRRQPLMVAATTAGDDPGSFAKIEHDFSARVAEDPSLAPRRFVFMRNAPKDVDPGDEETWERVNPAIGAGFLRRQVLRDEYESAKNNPRELRAFLQFRLNQWQDTPSTPWVSLEDWNATAQMVVEDQLKGRRAFGGLVAGSVSDLTSLCWTFPPSGPGEPWQALWRHFLPEEQLPDLIARTEGQAAQWTHRLILTEGDQIDVATHVSQIQDDLVTFDVQQLAHDTHGVIGIVQQIMTTHPRVPVGIAPNTPGTALLDWERLILAHEYHHGADPVTNWQMGHVMVKESVSGVLRIDRKNSVETVAAVYAAELALRRALLEPVYDVGVGIFTV